MGYKKLTAADALAMSVLEQACFSLPWTREQCLGALAQKCFGAYGFWQGDSLIAYISFYHHAEELEILNLGVAPKHRRQGQARRILQLLLQAAHKTGMQKAVLEVRESNFAAISLYEKCGFRRAGIRKKYYHDTGENALIYSRPLSNAP